MKGRMNRRDMLKLSGGVFAGAALLGVTGCGGGGSSGGGTLSLGSIGWDENIVVSNLSKVIMEGELGYDEVEIQGPLDLGPLFQGVASGELAAFQDVWLPNNQQYVDDAGGDVELLEAWYEDQTSYGLAVPDYMDVQSIADLNGSGADQITGIEPGASFMPVIEEEIIPGYNLNLELVTSSTAGMLAELERAYGNEEPIVFPAWSPHWMNVEYDFHYLDDPQNLQGSFDEPANVTSVVNADLEGDDPVAYAFFRAISLGEDQVNTIRLMQRDAGDDVEGARMWFEENRDAVQPWIDAANEAQG